MSIEVRAQNTISMTSVKAIKDATDQSAQLLAEMEQYAEDAGTTLTGIYQDAEDAKINANSAKTSAEIAQSQLSLVENVVGVLQLISEHGEFELTQDTQVVPNKWYFTRSGTAPDYVYSIVPNPSGDPSAQGWYEVTDIDEAIQNYVSSQLVLDTSGLWLKTTGMQTKVLLSSTEGVVLYGADGQQVGKYGDTAQIGNPNGFHITMSGTRLGFWKGDENVPTNEIAYISGQKLYITQSVVLEQMDLGTPVNNGGLGQWSWKVHPNGQTPSRNNLNLKWVG